MGLARNASFARAISAAIATVLACAAPSLAHAASLDAAAINDATLQAKPVRGINPAIVRTQIILDRLRFGPGIIDGHGGENVDRAIAAFQRRAGMQPTGKLDRETYDRIVEASSEPAVVEAKIEAGDVSGPFVKRIPAKLEQMAKLKRLGYRNAREALAEKYHVDETLLSALNPGAAFDKAGATLYVPDVRRDPVGAKVGRIEVLKDERRVRVLDETGVVLDGISRVDRQRRQARARWRVPGARGREEPDLHLRSEVRVQGREGHEAVRGAARAEWTRWARSGST